MSRMRRLSTVALTTLLASCHDGLLHSPSKDGRGTVALRTMMTSAATASNAAAYDKADRLFLRFRSGDELRSEQEVAFSPSATSTVVRVEVPLQALQEPISTEIELRNGTRALFRGATTATLSSGIVTPVEVGLEPVIASVTCGTGPLQFTSYGRTVSLKGAALFATGDAIDAMPVTFTVDPSAAASVTESGEVTSLADGDATVRCSAADLSSTLAVHVQAVVSSIQMNPPSATLVVGNSLPYLATLLDSLGNAITPQRTVTWASDASAIASVNSTGVVTGVAFGNTQIAASSGGITARAAVQVVSPTSAVTIAAVSITGNGATLRGSVNPSGTATTAWFEWGTDPSLTSPNITSSRAVGSGNTDINLSEILANLTPGGTYYFRVVASSGSIPVKGTILSFTTPRLPTVTTLTLDPANPTGYTMRGTVIPNGTPTQGRFEYGTSPTLAGAVQTAVQSVGSGNTAVTISQSLSGLQSFTTYYYRATAINVGGLAAGFIQSFRTSGPPSVLSPSANPPTGNCQTATPISSSANPNGIPSQAWFEYSTSSSLSTFTATTPQGIGSGSSFTGFASTIFVSPSGGVYYRAAASNSFGVSRSSIQGPIFAPLCIK
jgi:hypothetical protein